MDDHECDLKPDALAGDEGEMKVKGDHPHDGDAAQAGPDDAWPEVDQGPGWYSVVGRERPADEHDLFAIFDQTRSLLWVRIEAEGPAHAAALVASQTGVRDDAKTKVLCIRLDAQALRRRGQNLAPTLDQWLAAQQAVSGGPAGSQKIGVPGQAARTTSWHVVGIETNPPKGFEDLGAFFEYQQTAQTPWCRLLATDRDDAISQVVGKLQPVIEPGHRLWASALATYECGKSGAQNLPTLKQLVRQP